MSRGELVPDAITIGMLLERLGRTDAAPGAVLDGFPRNREQAPRSTARSWLAVPRWTGRSLIEVPADELVRRLSGRWICRQDGHVYHERKHHPRRGRVRHRRKRPVPARRRPARDDPGPPGPAARRAGDVIAYYRDRDVLGTVDGTVDEPK